MTINYGGSAGGQPRLFIPSMGQFQDPAVQTAMQQILQWANTLTAGGGCIAADSFEATGLDTWNSFSNPTFSYQAAVEWQEAGIGSVGTWTYLQSDNETFDFPPDSITVITGALSVEYTGNAASTAGVASQDSSIQAWASIPINSVTAFDITFPLTGLVTTAQSTIIALQDIINGPTVDLNGPYSILSLASFGAP